jgi:hypothetical protein
MDRLLTDIPNLFVRANVRFTYAGKPFDFPNHFISAYGISSIRWTVCDPRQIIGQKTDIEVTMLVGDKRTFRIKGEFVAERSKDSVYLVVRFMPSSALKDEIDYAIRQYGTVPTTHVRKYPRIPALDMISTMPLNAIMTFNSEFVVSRVANLSPNGILLCTDNPKLALIDPGQRMHCQLEPRGDFFAAIEFDGMVCRILEERDETTKNIMRYLGVRFTRFEEGQKQNFIALLQDILLRLKLDLERKKAASSKGGMV